MKATLTSDSAAASAWLTNCGVKLLKTDFFYSSRSFKERPTLPNFDVAALFCKIRA
ncbi:MAG: hypothetical protein ACJAQW_000930 [Paracoccaceae bacterium]|jgi:hypothetical protein